MSGLKHRSPALSSPPDSPSEHGPYTAAGEEALARLGINVRASLRESRGAFERVMPAAAAVGYYAALRRAIAAGEARANDRDDQLRWLAEKLRIERPAPDDPWPWWQRAWDAASRQAQLRQPERLDTPARQVLLRELLARPAYSHRLVDALSAAFREQLKRRR